MEPHARRMAIWNSLCSRRQETIAHLATEYHVSKRTIYYDVEILSLRPFAVVTAAESRLLIGTRPSPEVFRLRKCVCCSGFVIHCMNRIRKFS